MKKLEELISTAQLLDFKGTPVEKILLLGFFLSGYAALTYEQLWIQLLSMVYGGSTYSYAVLLGAFLGGLSIGSFIFGRLSDRINDSLIMLAWIEIGIGVSSLLVLPMFEKLDILYLVFIKNFSNPVLLLLFWAILPAFLLVPTMLMGATFPVAAQFYSLSSESRGRDIGILFAANTLGAVFGAWWTGFIYLPRIGFENTYVFAALANFTFASMIFLYVCRMPTSIYDRMRTKVYVAMLIFTILIFSAAGRELDVSFAGVYYIAPTLQIEEWKQLKENSNILFNKYGPHGMVTVGEDAKIKYLSVNGKPEASAGPFDLDGQYLLGYIPMFAHNNPRKVLHIGTGAGFTLDAVRNFEVERIDAVEINSLVSRAAEELFYNETNNVFSDPRINFVTEDGRLFMESTDERYDVIVSTPSNPWVSGVSSLFTTEFYKIAKSRLAGNGILTIWAPLYEYDFVDLKIYLNSVSTVFPEVNAFIAGGDMIIIASNEPIKINYTRLEEKLKDERIARHFTKIGTYYGVPIRNEDKLLGAFMLNTEEIKQLVSKVEIISTDDKPALEFLAARKAILKAGKRSSPLDTIHEIYKFKTRISPPLDALAVSNGRNTEYKHMKIKVSEGDRWVLDAVAYNYEHLPNLESMLSYYVDKFFRYKIGDSGVLFVKQEDIFPGPTKEEEIRRQVEEVLSPESISYIGKVDKRDEEHPLPEEAMVYEVDIAGGSLKGVVHAWYCKENQAFYIAAVAYPVNVALDADDALSRVMCFHEH